jgi:hypothetical protein
LVFTSMLGMRIRLLSIASVSSWRSTCSTMSAGTRTDDCRRAGIAACTAVIPTRRRAASRKANRIAAAETSDPSTPTTIRPVGEAGSALRHVAAPLQLWMPLRSDCAVPATPQVLPRSAIL